jgi:ribosome biogenesis protein MAK21
MRVYFELFVTLLKSGSLGIGPQKDDDDKPKGPDKISGPPGKPSAIGPDKKSGALGKPPHKNGVPKPGEQDIEAADKLVSAILTGVNRAAPFVGENDAM